MATVLSVLEQEALLSEAAAAEDDSLAVARDPHDVHALASEAADLEAQTEQFFDQVLITEINETPLTTLDGVLDERFEATQRRDRFHARHKELLAEELAKQKHEREVKDLEDAINTTNQPMPINNKGNGKSKLASVSMIEKSVAAAPSDEKPKDGRSPSPEEAAPSAAVAAIAATLPFQLESLKGERARDANPYVLNLTEFVPETEATRQARELRAESDLLRKCLEGHNSSKPRAFEGYLKHSRSAHHAL